MENRTVGRPKGSVHAVSHNERISKILDRFGVNVKVSKVKAEIARLNKICKVENQIAMDKALDVKIARVRAKMLKEQIGVSRATVGRMTLLERELVASKLELLKVKAEVVAPVDPAPVAEVAA